MSFGPYVNTPNDLRPLSSRTETISGGGLSMVRFWLTVRFAKNVHCEHKSARAHLIFPFANSDVVWPSDVSVQISCSWWLLLLAYLCKLFAAHNVHSFILNSAASKLCKRDTAVHLASLNYYYYYFCDIRARTYTLNCTLFSFRFNCQKHPWFT